MPEKKNSVSVLIPSYNEAENIESLLKRISLTLNRENINYEILVIDDNSQDNTADLAGSILSGIGRVIKRNASKRSLSLSVLEGIKNAQGNHLIVMDADGSHPPELIPGLLNELNQGCGLVIASRYVKGGSCKNFPLKRRLISKAACLLGRTLTRIRDNTSGFFCIKKESLAIERLKPYGFKIGLEIFIKADYGSFKEIPYTFINRKKGKSKLSPVNILLYFYQLVCLFIYKVSHTK